MAAKKNLKKVEKKRQKASIKLHREIYREAAVKEAVRAYSGFARFACSGQGKYVRVVITPKNGPVPEHLADEFLNMVLCNSI